MRPVLALHGFGGSGRDFDVVREHLPEPLELHGPNIAAPSVAACMSLIDKWRYAEGRKDAVLLGYSMGGRMALQYAARRHLSLSGLVLVSATPGVRNAGEREARLAEEATLAEHIRTVGVDAFTDEGALRPMIATPDRLPQRGHDEMVDRRRRNTADALIGVLRGMGTGRMTSVWSRLPEIDIPVLLVSGEEDPKYRNIADDMLDHLPSARHVCIEDAGHAPHLEQPTAFGAVLVDFLRELD